MVPAITIPGVSISSTRDYRQLCREIDQRADIYGDIKAIVKIRSWGRRVCGKIEFPAVKAA